MRARTLLGGLSCLALGWTTGCHSRSAARAEAKELAMATAASEQLNLAFAEDAASKVISRTKSAYYAKSDTISACDDRVDQSGWQTVRSSVVDMDLPPDFVANTRSSGRGAGVIEWRTPDGAYIRVDPHGGTSPHDGWTGLITSECMVYISGARTHIDARRTMAGLGLHALLTPDENGGIAVEADHLTPDRLAEMLHALRTIRISANWRAP